MFGIIKVFLELFKTKLGVRKFGSSQKSCEGSQIINLFLETEEKTLIYTNIIEPNTFAKYLMDFFLQNG